MLALGVYRQEHKGFTGRQMGGKDAPQEMRGLDPIDDIIPTLVTCDPLEYVGTAPDRFIGPASRPSP